jgi:2'-5' RNA ligase
MTDTANVGADERLRLFIALRLPEPVLDAVETWQHEHLRGVRPVPRDHLHITVAFLGHRPAGELPAVLGELRAAANVVAPPPRSSSTSIATLRASR